MYKSARIVDVIDQETIGTCEPTLEAAKAALKQWMTEGDRQTVTRFENVTVVQIIDEAGEPSDFIAQLFHA